MCVREAEGEVASTERRHTCALEECELECGVEWWQRWDGPALGGRMITRTYLKDHTLGKWCRRVRSASARSQLQGAAPARTNTRECHAAVTFMATPPRVASRVTRASLRQNNHRKYAAHFFGDDSIRAEWHAPSCGFPPPPAQLVSNGVIRLVTRDGSHLKPFTSAPCDGS